MKHNWTLGKDGKPHITERAFQEQVRKAAILAGWKYYHTHNSMHSAKGFPDCVLVKNGRLWFVELKSETGKVSEEQQDWLDALCLCPRPYVRAIVLWPSGFDQFWEELNVGRVALEGK